MRLTTHTDYAFRVLIYLGTHRDELCTIKMIALAFDISQHHVAKVVRQLGKLRYVAVHRGRNGGLELGMKPAEICLGDLVRDFEADTDIVECFNPQKNTCVISPACSLRLILGNSRDAFYEVLDGCTLEDIVGRGRARQLLEIL